MRCLAFSAHCAVSELIPFDIKKTEQELAARKKAGRPGYYPALESIVEEYYRRQGIGKEQCSTQTPIDPAGSDKVLVSSLSSVYSPTNYPSNCFP